MFPIAAGVEFCLELVTTGSGGFDGVTEKMRAGVTVNGPISSGNVIVRAKNQGALLNDYTIQFLDPGTGITFPTTQVTQVGSDIFVKLRRDSSSGILATAQEVAQAINAVTEYGFPIAADPQSTSSTVVQATSPISLSAGLDFDVIDPTGRYFSKKFTNENVGVFYFGNLLEGLQIRKIQAKFSPSADVHLKIQNVRLSPGLGVVANSNGPFLDYDLSTTEPDFGVTDIKDPLLPYEALIVSCKDGSNTPQAGMVRIYAKRAANFPF